MRRAVTSVRAVVVAFAMAAAARGQGGPKPPPPPATPAVYFAVDEKLKDRVRLSDEMAAKVVEILARKPKPFERTLRVLPEGYFSVDGKTYPFYGFLTSDPQKGDSRADPALERFRDELFRVRFTEGLGPVKTFKP